MIEIKSRNSNLIAVSEKDSLRETVIDRVERSADLSCADLSGADLFCANLSGTNLSRANLSRAALTEIKKDFFGVLSVARDEVLFLRKALLNGKISGSHYEGKCACLIGTIANARHCNYKEIDGLAPDSKRPAERWFLGIQLGCNPENNAVAAITLEWIDEFVAQKDEQRKGW